MRTYGGATGNERLAERRTRLLAAGLDLLASDDGPRAFTVRGVCREAGLASRYFYESFEDADDLAAAIYDEEIIALTTVTLGAMDGIPDDVKRFMGAALEAMIGHIAEDPRRGRLLYAPALAALPAIAERRKASTRLFVGLLTDEARSRTPLEDGPAAAVLAEILVGGLAQAIAAWLDGEVPMSQADFVEACTQPFVATLDRV